MDQAYAIEVSWQDQTTRVEVKIAQDPLLVVQDGMLELWYAYCELLEGNVGADYSISLLV